MAILNNVLMGIQRHVDVIGRSRPCGALNVGALLSCPLNVLTSCQSPNGRIKQTLCAHG